MNTPDISEEELLETVMSVYRRDPAAINAGVEVLKVEEDAVTLRQKIDAGMLNGHKVLHGGHMFFLADTAFAYRMALTGADYLSRSAEIIFIAPVFGDQEIYATARIRTQFGRNAICDIQVVDETSKVVAEIRVNGVMARQ